LNGTDVSTNKSGNIWTWWRRKWFSGRMVVVSFSQDSFGIHQQMTIRSKCDRDPGSLPEIAWEEKGWLRKEEDLTKMERMICRERPKNSAEMLYSSVKTLQRLHNQYQHITIPRGTHPKIDHLSHHSFNKSK